MAVQSPLDSLDGDPISIFNIAIDGRQQTDPPVDSSTLSCFLKYIAVSAPVRKMLGSASLADLAIPIRKGPQRANNQFTDDAITLINKFEGVTRLALTAFLDVPGFNYVQTSWVKFKLYSVGLGFPAGWKDY